MSDDPIGPRPDISRVPPMPEMTPQMLFPEPAAPPAAPTTFATVCPGCRRLLRAAGVHAERWGRCRYCGQAVWVALRAGAEGPWPLAARGRRGPPVVVPVVMATAGVTASLTTRLTDMNLTAGGVARWAREVALGGVRGLGGLLADLQRLAEPPPPSRRSRRRPDLYAPWAYPWPPHLTPTSWVGRGRFGQAGRAGAVSGLGGLFDQRGSPPHNRRRGLPGRLRP